MFDIGWPELMLVAVLVIVVVGPKDLPRVMRTVAHYVGKAKSMTREFRGYVDDMVRESELDEIKSQIEAGADLDAGGLVENTIDPDRDIQDALAFDDSEFDIKEDSEEDSAGLDPEIYGDDAAAGAAADERPDFDDQVSAGAPADESADESAGDETGGNEKVAS